MRLNTDDWEVDDDLHSARYGDAVCVVYGDVVYEYTVPLYSADLPETDAPLSFWLAPVSSMGTQLAEIKEEEELSAGVAGFALAARSKPS